MTSVGGLILDGHRIIWKVNNFLKLDRDYEITSPLRYVNKKWRLNLYPIGSEDGMCKGWMYFRLENRSDQDLAFRIRISLVGRDDKVIVSTGAEWLPDVTTLSGYFQTPKLINRSELEFLGEQAMPGGTLTLVLEIQTPPNSVHGIKTFSEKSKLSSKEPKNSRASFKPGELPPKNSKESQNSEVGVKIDDDSESKDRLSKSVLRLLQDLEGMLLFGSNSDVTLTVAGKSYRAHRAILSARSTGFSEIFARDASGEIVVDFRNAESFSDFLHYLYTGKESEVTSENARDLCELAMTYGVDELKSVCQKCMVERVSTRTYQSTATNL